jgi:hypothetical protein
MEAAVFLRNISAGFVGQRQCVFCDARNECMISGFRRDVNEICSLLGYCTAYNEN